MPTSEKQRTIKKEFSLQGVGLHTGNTVKLVFKPAESNAGIRFVRVDLSDRPIIKADFSNVLLNSGIPRCTTIGKGEAVIHTVEHLMAVLCGLRIDNLIVEINGNELPGLDGSGIDFLKAIKLAGIVEQEAPRSYFYIKETICVEYDGRIIVATPATDFKISYTLDYHHSDLEAQFFSLEVNEESFEKEIAPCRTFCLESEEEELRKRGLGKGANYENTLVVSKKIVKGNKLRFQNEFARHKILDFIGDLYLLGSPICGHIIAVKSGHNLNLQLLKKIAEQLSKKSVSSPVLPHHFAGATELDINAIMKILPHRYPFLLVDRVISLEQGKRVVGVKNVTINDNFFQGHFPTRPIMPGVLIMEAMAQVGGMAVLTDKQHEGKVAFFMAADNVKFRKVVVPGDQLVMETKVIRNKTKMAQIHAEAKVGGEIVAEADLIFSFTDANYLN